MAVITAPCGDCGAPVTRKIQPKVRMHFCATKCKANWQRRARPVTEEWLRQKYLVEMLDMVQIAAIVKRDPTRVDDWMKDLGIPTRPRGTATHMKPGVRFGAGNIGKKATAGRLRQLREISIKDGRVPYLKNGRHWLKGVRKEDHPNWKGGHTPERQAFYASEEWKVAVKAVWHRADAKCERCGVHHNTAERRGTFNVHHVVSFSVRELRATVTNLALLCYGCHRFVHSPKNLAQEFIKEI